jgi:hypothetical protein
MSPSGFLALLPLLVGFAAAGTGPSRPTVTRLVQNDELILRVPVQPPQPRIEWQQGRALRCVPVRAIRGAALSGPENIDVLLGHRQRVRANFAADCPAIDFYGGFYLKPQDGKLCAGRDLVYSRMGGSCRIEGFHLLVPQLKRQSP